MSDGRVGPGCMVKVVGPGVQGSGVLVAPDPVLTCAHVASTAGEAGEEWRGPLQPVAGLAVHAPDRAGARVDLA